MEKQQDVIEIDVIRLLKAIWHKIWVVILVALLCGALAFSYANFLIDPTYESSALMYVNNSSFSLGSTSFSISSSELSAAQSLVDTYLVILNSRMTLTRVIELAHLDYSYEDLTKMISASAVNGTEIFKVTVTSTNPQEAEKIANTIAEVLPYKIADIVDGSSVRIVDYAIVPSEKAAPSITKYTAIGLFAGIFISCAIIVILDLLDNQVHGADTLPFIEEIPLLADIPDLHVSGNSSEYHSYVYGYGNTTEIKA